MKHIYLFLLPVAELIPESFDSSFVPILQFRGPRSSVQYPAFHPSLSGTSNIVLTYLVDAFLGNFVVQMVLNFHT